MTVIHDRPTRTDPVGAQSSSPAARTGHRIAFFVTGLTVATGAAALVWIHLSSGGNEARPAIPQTSTAYQAGGSVYREQVPAYTDSVAVGPNSSTYREQVPAY